MEIVKFIKRKLLKLYLLVNEIREKHMKRIGNLQIDIFL